MDKTVFWLSIFGILAMSLVTIFSISNSFDMGFVPYKNIVTEDVRIDNIPLRVSFIVFCHGIIYFLLILCLIYSLKKNKKGENNND